jgi:hypothetical protein
MPLLGPAAMLLSFDVAPEAIPEHDDWHTHEHLPERLSIPGFLRGTRWVALHGEPRYLVLYEVEHLSTLTSEPYLRRLNSPTAWTSKMMPHYRGMTRGFCAVAGSFGLGIGHAARLIRFKPEARAAAAIEKWLLDELLPSLPARRGFGGAHLLRGAVAPPMTNEQRIRGADATVDWALLLTGYDEGAPAGAGISELERHGATALPGTVYRFDYSLARGEFDSRPERKT